METEQTQTQTHFAPPERVDTRTLERQRNVWLEAWEEQPVYRVLVDSVNVGVLVVNTTRQIIFANHRVAELFGVSKPGDLMGARVGEALRCQNASDASGGCGTARPCRYCGLIQSVLDEEDDERRFDCRLLRENCEALDLGVYSKRLSLNDEPYVLLSLEDTSDEKRREALERIFFHDVLNTLSVLQMGIEVSQDELPPERARMLMGATRRVVGEIRGQRALMQAERGALSVLPSDVDGAKLLREIAEEYKALPDAQGIEVDLASVLPSLPVKTDGALLSRILSNLVKNALEASSGNDRVTLGCEVEGDMARFWVKNPAVMATSTRMQVFQRSFSTRGSGRGLGTYGVKLLVERYLKGRVYFQSILNEGTTFCVELPLEFPH